MTLTAPPLYLLNRIPEPGDVGVPDNSSGNPLEIVFDLNTTTGNIEMSQTDIYVTHPGTGLLTLAYDGSAGTFQTGFDGPNSAVTFPFAGTETAHFVIDVNAGTYASEAIVQVKVETAVGSLVSDETYSFTIEDTTSPSIADATAIGVTQVLVTFNEPVRTDDATATDDALNPANYTVTAAPADGECAVDVIVESVDFVADSIVVLKFDRSLSPGVPYTVVGANIEDDAGNLIDSVAFTFTGFVPPAPDGRSWDLTEFVPDVNLREDETIGDLRKFLCCMQEVATLLIYDVDLWTDILDPDKAPEAFVDAMLQDLGNPFRFELSLIDKRRLISVLVDIYRSKGVDEGIENAIRFFMGLEVRVVPVTQEGWVLGVDSLGVDTVLGVDDPSLIYSYDIEVDAILTATQRAQMREIAEYMDRAEEHLRTIVEPDPPAGPIDHWSLGESAIGETTILH